MLIPLPLSSPKGHPRPGGRTAIAIPAACRRPRHPSARETATATGAPFTRRFLPCWRRLRSLRRAKRHIRARAEVTTPASPPAQARASTAARTASTACPAATRQRPAHPRPLPRRPRAVLPGLDAKLAAPTADAVPQVPHLRLGIGLHRSLLAVRMLGSLPGVLAGRLLMDSDCCLTGLGDGARGPRTRVYDR
jgi:hypothetical protein